jgi:hypothetical protein
MTVKAFVTGVSVFGPSGFGADAWRAGRVDDEVLASALTLRGLRPLSRTARLAMVVAADVLPPGTTRGMRDAIVLGSAWSSVGPLADFVQVAAAHGEDRVFPMAFPNTVVSVHVGYIASLLGCTGPALSVCGRYAGLETVLAALSLLESGRADRVVAMGVDAAEPVVACALGEEVGEGAGAVLVSSTVQDGYLATITGCWTTPTRKGQPATPAAIRSRPIEDPTVGAGAADGAVAVANAAIDAARKGEAVTVRGRAGITGLAAIRLEPS